MSGWSDPGLWPDRRPVFSYPHLIQKQRKNRKQLPLLATLCVILSEIASNRVNVAAKIKHVFVCMCPCPGIKYSERLCIFLCGSVHFTHSPAAQGPVCKRCPASHGPVWGWEAAESRGSLYCTLGNTYWSVGTSLCSSYRLIGVGVGEWSVNRKKGTVKS